MHHLFGEVGQREGKLLPLFTKLLQDLFKALRELRDDLNTRTAYPEVLTELSMGMSGDFEVAAEEGATWVRVGTALFE